jgi:hypothetical protein
LFLSCDFYAHQFDLTHGQLQFIAKDYDSQIRIVAAIHKAALRQREFSLLPGPRVPDGNIANFAKRAFKQTFRRIGVVIFEVESRTSRITIGYSNDNAQIVQPIGERTVYVEVR